MTKLDTPVSEQITRVLEDRIALHQTPRKLGKAMVGKWKGFWRFRIGDYPVICEIRDAELIIVVISAGHRKEIYY